MDYTQIIGGQRISLYASYHCKHDTSWAEHIIHLINMFRLLNYIYFDKLIKA